MTAEKGTSRIALRDAQIMAEAGDALGRKFCDTVFPQLRQGHFWDAEKQALKGTLYSEFRGHDATFVHLEIDSNLGIHIERLNRSVSLNPRADNTGGYDLVKHGHMERRTVMEMLDLVGKQIEDGKLSFKIASKPHHRAFSAPATQAGEVPEAR